jgi:RNA polymerase sigma-70 factor (ECF subfamily)
VYLYGPLIHRWCQQGNVPDDDVADVGQEVFRAIAHGIERFRRERPTDSFTAWLRTLTRYKVADYWRYRSRETRATGGSDFQRRLGEIASVESGEDSSDSAVEEKVIVVARALELLQARCHATTWQAFWATAVEDQSPQDVAAELGITAMAVRQAKSRMLRRLRELLE